MPRSERYEKGAAKMKELFGAEPRPGMLQEDFLQITVENLFGDIWNRPGLELKERSMITVAAARRAQRWHQPRENQRDDDPPRPLRRLAGRSERLAYRERGV